MEKLTIRIETIVNPTEDEEKVKNAIKNIFPKISINLEETGGVKVVRGECEGRECLEKMRMLIRSRRIRTTARAFLKSHITNGRIEFLLNKQAASTGRVSFCEHEGETPLGAIRVVIASDDVGSVVEWLTE